MNPIVGPLIRDYGHRGNYEELWLLEKAFSKGRSNRTLYEMYDTSFHPREECPSLDLLDREGATRCSVEESAGYRRAPRDRSRAQQPDRGFRQKAMRPLRERLSDEAYSGLLGVTGSQTIFAGRLDLLGQDPADLAGAMSETIRHATEACDRLDVEATPNLALTDGTATAFTRYATHAPGTSLYVPEDAGAFARAFVVASKRLDGDPAWRAVPDRHLLSVRHGSGATLGPP
jgi:hypothetical protein